MSVTLMKAFIIVNTDFNGIFIKFCNKTMDHYHAEESQPLIHKEAINEPLNQD